MSTRGRVRSYSEKICRPVFVGESTGDVFTGAAAHLRVLGWYVHLVLKTDEEKAEMKHGYKMQTERYVAVKSTAEEMKSGKMLLTVTAIYQNVLDTYWSTFLGAVDRGNFHGVEARVWISVMQAVDSVTQLSFKVLHQRLAWAQHCYPLE